MIRMKRRSWFLVTFILIMVATTLTLPSSSATSELSSRGQRAFEDLARCLNSKDTLDVFYLIDESGSLKQTDSQNKRAPILGESLRELGSLKDDLKVNYAVGFFGDKYSTWQPWTSITAGNIESAARELEREVVSRNRGQATDWLLGVESAAEELRKQRAKTRGCQVLIWLTDGAIDTSLASYSEADAVVELCERTFNSLRQSKVTVLGVLLKSEKDLSRLDPDEREWVEAWMSRMYPLVEGRGDVGVPPDVESVGCGEDPLPANYSAGALLVADDPISLAYQFLRLGSLLSGGTKGSLSAGNPGKFLIEAGVARFRIITTSTTWTLTSPEGKRYNENSKIDIATSGGATQVTVPVTPELFGEWTFRYQSESSNELILFSGLSLKLDDGELVAGRSGVISGTVVSEFGNRPVDLGVYGDAQVTVQEVSGSGATGPVRNASLVSQNAFSLPEFTPTPDQGQVEIRVVLNVKTKSGLALAPVSVARNLVVRLPSNYPSLTNSPIRFTPIEGTSGEGVGEIQFLGPQQGNGKVCLGTPSVVSDSVDRSDEYRWSTSGDLRDGCIDLAQDERVSIELMVSNGVPANADVLADLPVTYFSDSEGEEFTLNARLEVPTETTPGGWLVAAFLVVLGFLLPMLAIYLMTLFTTKIALGQSMQRAQWSVRVDSLKGIVGPDGDQLRPAAEDFKFLPDRTDSRTFTDAIGEMRARVSKLVFPSPWFELTAQDGTRIITMVAGPVRALNRFKSGRISPIRGNIDNVWALSLNESELRNLGSNTSIPAQLIIFKRNNLANKNQFMERFLQVTTTAGVWSQIQSLSQHVVTEVQAKPLAERKSRKRVANESERDGIPSTSGSTPPPPIGINSAPPIPGSPPSLGSTSSQSPSAGNDFPPPPPGLGGGLPPKPPGA